MAEIVEEKPVFLNFDLLQVLSLFYEKDDMLL